MYAYVTVFMFTSSHTRASILAVDRPLPVALSLNSSSANAPSIVASAVKNLNVHLTVGTGSPISY